MSILRVRLIARVLELPQPTGVKLSATLEVKPPIPTFAEELLISPATLGVSSLPVPLTDALMTEIQKIIAPKIWDYFDQNRKLKTLLNFGNDSQSLVTNWKRDTADTTDASLYVKLYKPLPSYISEKSLLWISRELSAPITDRLLIDLSVPEVVRAYLRPANKNITITSISGIESGQITLASTVPSSSLGQTDPVLQQWYTYEDYKSAQLNVDYTNYRNFVHFSSADSRLTAFINKLSRIESIDFEINRFKNATSASGFGPTSWSLSQAYLGTQNLSNERETVLRSFDGYEQFLYYNSGSAYSSSLTDDNTDTIYHNADCTWPKISGSVAPLSSSLVASWYTTQSVITKKYDETNYDSLRNNVPEYLQNDVNSLDYLIFVDMIAHMLDGVKSYIDNMHQMYDRNSNPLEGLSQDIVWNIAQSLGFELPNPHSLAEIAAYTIGTEKNYRTLATEVWKRFLHNHIFMLKTKGTKQSIQALINSFGFMSSVITVNETATPAVTNYTSSYEIYDETTNALLIDGDRYLTIPWSGSLPSQSMTMELRFKPTTVPTTLIASSNAWKLEAVTSSYEYGYIRYTADGQTPISTSPEAPLFDGNFHTLMVRSSGSVFNINVSNADGGDIVYHASTSSVDTKWFSASVENVYLTGSSYIDEFRVWSEYISDKTFEFHTKYPGLYNGNEIISARDNLFVRLSFNKVQNLSSSLLPNESPYTRQPSCPSSLYAISASNYLNSSSYPYSMTEFTREVQRYSPNIGAVQRTTNNVYIAPPPVLTGTIVDGTFIPVLQTNKSIVTPVEKSEQVQMMNTVEIFFSIAAGINDNIIRSFGNVDYMDLIGDPSAIYSSSYAELDMLNEIYWNDYAYPVDVNKFFRFVKNLLGPFFEQVEQYVPIRANLLTGLVIEQPSLERTRIPTRPIVFGGKNTRHINEPATVDFIPDTSMVNDISAGNIDNTFIVDINETTTPKATVSDNLFTVDLNQNNKVEVDTSNPDMEVIASDVILPKAEPSQFDWKTAVDETLALHGAYQDLFDNIGLTDSVNSPMFYSTYDIISEEYRTQIEQARYGMSNYPINAYRYHGLDLGLGATFTSQVDLFNLADEACNFDKLGSTEYYTDPDGYVAGTDVKNVRMNEKILNARGYWNSSSLYSVNDYVSHSVNGNIREYQCVASYIVTSSVNDPTRATRNQSVSSFSSSIEPNADTGRWHNMIYVPTVVPVIKRIVKYVYALPYQNGSYYNRGDIVNDPPTSASWFVNIRSTAGQANGTTLASDTNNLWRHYDAPLTKIAIDKTGSLGEPKIGGISLTPFMGYAKNHYKNFRPTYTAWMNSRYVGCLQTSLTTSDGKMPVEVTISSGDKIIAQSGTQPVQPGQDSSGPILRIE